MGVSQSCALDRLSNLCQMEKCVTGVTGRDSDSASSTDTWVCKLEPGTTYEGQAIPSTFMKIGINPASMPKPARDGNKNKQRDALERIQAATGLMYEFQVYHSIVTPILDAGICPNFLRSYLVSYNCQYDDLLSTLKKGLASHRINPNDASQHLNRNLNYMYYGQKNRPAIQSTDGLRVAAPLPSLRYMVLTTEFNNVTDYWEWLGQDHSPESRSVVLLQIAVGLYVMSKAKLMHNDLRAPNIFVRKLPKPTSWTYKINDVLSICISTVYLALIYDFDRGTSFLLGDNPYVKESGIYPADLPLFEENRDLACLYKSLTPNAKRAKDSLIPRFFDVKAIKKDTDWYEGRGDEIRTTLIDGIRAIADTLPALPPAGTVYNILDSKFNRNGSLNPDYEDLDMLHAQSRKHSALLAEYKESLATCNAIRRRLEAKVNRIQAVPKERRAIDR